MKFLIPLLIAVALAGCDRTTDGVQDAGNNTGAGSENIATENKHVPEEAQAPGTAKDPSGRVFEYGIYTAQRKGRIRDSIAANTGKVITRPVLELAEQTGRVPLVKETYFAYRFRILDLPKEVAKKPVVKLRKVLNHPEMTLPDGSRTTGSERTFKGRLSVGQVIGFDGYAFNEDYELVEGDWTFQIWYQDKLMVEQTFTMYWPEEGAGGDPEPADPAAGSSI